MNFKHRLRILAMQYLPKALFRAIRLSRLKRTLTPPQFAALSRLDGNSTVVDCGANIGEFSALFASFGARVFAFEPDPYAFKELARNCRRFKTVTCYEAALTERSEPETVEFFFHRDRDKDPAKFSQASSLMGDKPNVDGGSSVRVQNVNLIEFIRDNAQHVDLLKMDIEGYEVELVPGMVEAGIFDRIGTCFIERHDAKFPELREKTRAMMELIKTRNLEDKIHVDWH